MSKSELGYKLLKKMGWTEGTGIGKSSTGIVEPIKPRLKIGTTGVGFKESEHGLCTGWWMEAFNKAAAANATGAQSGSRELSGKQQQPSRTSPTELPVLGRPYTAFASAAAVLRDGREIFELATPSGTTPAPMPTPTDEELLAACGGRTAHPAARFGLGLGGKLARVRAQDLRGEAAAEAADEGDGSESRRRRSGKKKRKRRRRSGEQKRNDSDSDQQAAATEAKVART